MIKIIESREQFDSLLTDDKTLVFYGKKGNLKCKEQFKILNGMEFDIPVFCTDIEAPGMADYVDLNNLVVPLLVIFEDYITKSTRQGLQGERSILNFIGS